MTIPGAADDRFDAVCVVGLGNHARTKLIPALLANGQRIAGVVSSQPKPGVPNADCFRTIDEALDALSPDTLYVLATPPQAHHGQAMTIIDAGRDVMVEKPAFELRSQAVEAFAAAAERQTLLIEAFMHRHTNLFRDAVKYWTDEAAAISVIDIRFTIPALPSDTFRNAREPISSCLYDIGCYAISLVSDFGLPLDGLTLGNARVDKAGRDELITVSGQAGAVGVTITVGVNDVYFNTVSYVMRDGRKFIYEPFFYGRAGERRCTIVQGESAAVTKTAEDDAFRTMFAVPRSVWRMTQRTRGNQLIAVTECLERLGAELRIARRP